MASVAVVPRLPSRRSATWRVPQIRALPVVRGPRRRLCERGAGVPAGRTGWEAGDMTGMLGSFCAGGTPPTRPGGGAAADDISYLRSMSRHGADSGAKGPPGVAKVTTG